MNTIICENCNTEFRKVFSFNSNGEGVHYFECPNCGAHTRPHEIAFTEEGNVILAKNKEGNPILAYQVANPNDEKTYGNVISIKQEDSGDSKKQQRAKKKPFSKFLNPQVIFWSYIFPPPALPGALPKSWRKG